MPGRPRRNRTLAVASICALAFSCPSFATQSGFEHEPEVDLADMLPVNILRSGNHRVGDNPELRRNHVHVTVESDLGFYRVDSLPMLLRRVHEIRTLSQAIDDFQRSNRRLAVKLRGQLEVGADSFVQILAHPLDTSEKLASQLGANVDETFQALQHSGPQAPADSQAKGAPIDANDPILGSYKRSVAGQLDLDVYSSNPRVQSFLNEVSFARSHGRATAGTMSVGLGQPLVRPVDGGAVKAATRSAVTRNSVAELRERNGRKLRSMGIDEPLVDAFLGHRRLTPTHQTAITEYLDFVADAGNRGALLEAALRSRSETEAAGAVESGRLLALYHQLRRPLTELLAAAHLVVARAADRTMVVVLPFDVLYWNKATADVFNALATHVDSAGYRNAALVLTGEITPLAREKLESAGFAVFERFGLRS